MIPARYLDANDHQVVHSVIDAPFRCSFQRHGLSMAAGTRSAGISIVLDALSADNGADEPVHFLQFTNVEKTAFDRGIYAFFANEKAWP